MNIAGITLFLTSCLLVPWYCSGESLRDQIKVFSRNCYTRKIETCFGKFMLYTENGTGLATTEETLDQQCKTFQDIINCAQDYIKSCGSPFIWEAVSLVGQKFLEGFQGFCTKDSEIRKRWFKIAPCVDQYKRTKIYRETCIRQFQLDLELVTEDIAFEKMYTTGCCSYRRWIKCLVDGSVEACGKDSKEPLEFFVTRFFADIVKHLCDGPEMDPTGDTCIASLYPMENNDIPLGLRSKSVFSKLFTIACPKVGYH